MDIEVPFTLSQEEQDLVEMPMSSLFILGRSGTGKTTVLIFRMFFIQQVCHIL
jgi:type IV secretory pathway ATPase VirB11/archaellum biosynthesis ATPase